VSVSEAVKLRSRRALLAGAASAAGAAVLSACGTKALRKKIATGAHVVPGDIDALNSLLDVENYAIAAYAAGLPLLGPDWAKIAKQFLSQELAHAVEIRDLVRGAGGKPHRPASSYNLGDPRTAGEALALLESVERAQLHAYLQMIPRLSGGHVRAAVATIFANDAQHLAVLRVDAGQPLPGAFAVA
jgi:hypothetical protein